MLHELVVCQDVVTLTPDKTDSVFLPSKRASVYTVHHEYMYYSVGSANTSQRTIQTSIKRLTV